MAYMCGSNTVAPGTICSDGTPAKWVASGNTQPQSTVSADNYAWNADTRPVTTGYKYGGSGSTPDTIDRYVVEHTNVADAKNKFNEWFGAAHVANASKSDKQRYRIFLAALRNYTGSEIGTRGSAETAWGQVLDDAASAGVDAMDLLFGGKGAGNGSSSGGGGGGSATPTVSAQNMHRLVDQTTQQYAGREATNAEAKAFTKQVRGSLSNPNTDPTFMAEEFAKNTPEATTYAANNYMKVFLQSLGGLGG